MRQSAISFQAKGLEFEGVIAQPEGITGTPAVVICHPHPLFGGNMDNNVVLAVSFALAEAGFTTLRFNFRGVGNSQGEHSKGEHEHEEALAALDVIKAWPGVDKSKIGLTGYSFGSRVILGHPELHKTPRAFALISPNLPALDGTKLKQDKKPKLIISGDRDKLVESDKLKPTLESFEHTPTFHLVEGADHSWFNYEHKLTPHVTRFFAEHLK